MIQHAVTTEVRDFFRIEYSDGSGSTTMRDTSVMY
jgi:hypothetical protein